MTSRILGQFQTPLHRFTFYSFILSPTAVTSLMDNPFNLVWFVLKKYTWSYSRILARRSHCHAIFRKKHLASYLDLILWKKHPKWTEFYPPDRIKILRQIVSDKSFLVPYSISNFSLNLARERKKFGHPWFRQWACESPFENILAHPNHSV